MERRYFLSVRPLTARNFPALVVRHEHVTLHIIDPRASALHMLAASLDLLDSWELDTVRGAYNQPPAGHPLADEFMDGMVLPFVPKAIRVPGEPPVQNALTHTPEYHAAYGRAFAWAINERWGFEQTYQHPHPPVQRQGTAA